MEIHAYLSTGRRSLSLHKPYFSFVAPRHFAPRRCKKNSAASFLVCRLLFPLGKEKWKWNFSLAPRARDKDFTPFASKKSRKFLLIFSTMRARYGIDENIQIRSNSPLLRLVIFNFQSRRWNILSRFPFLKFVILEKGGKTRGFRQGLKSGNGGFPRKGHRRVEAEEGRETL